MNGLKLILAVVLIAVNAFFVIAEYALVRSRRSRLEVMQEEGARGAALALAQLESINDYISAVQIGVTMTSIAIGALGAPALAEIAEAANHHPDILLHGWNKVRLTLSTHSQGGLTDADFQLAARVDQLA